MTRHANSEKSRSTSVISRTSACVQCGTVFHGSPQRSSLAAKLHLKVCKRPAGADRPTYEQVVKGMASHLRSQSHVEERTAGKMRTGALGQESVEVAVGYKNRRADIIRAATMAAAASDA